jgi:CRP-like cAMP-binding protein
LNARLAAHPFLAGLAPAQIAKLSEHAREAAFAPGALLLREGEEADASFLIISGRVGLEIRTPTRTVQVASAGAGEVVGWSWLATPNRWHFDARASDDVAAIVLDGAALRDACERDPALGFALAKRFMSVVTKRLEAVRLQLIDVYGAHEVGPWA